MEKDETETTPITEVPPLTEQQKKQLEEEEEVERALEAIEEDELTLQPDTGTYIHTKSIKNQADLCNKTTVTVPMI